MYSKMLSVRICFVLDCTASMHPWIHAAKRKVVEIVDNVHHEYPDADVQVGLVGYRDYDDRQRFHITDFTTADILESQLREIRAEGGDDEAEDVANALYTSIGLSWGDADVCMVFHIADAPAHGLVFHEPHISDRFPGGDPDGFDPRRAIMRFAENGVRYAFIKMTQVTDKMIGVFQEAYGGDGFQVIDLTPQRAGEDPAPLLSSAVSRAVSDTIMHYTASQSQ